MYAWDAGDMGRREQEFFKKVLLRVVSVSQKAGLLES